MIRTQVGMGVQLELYLHREPSEYRYKAQRRNSCKIHVQVDTTHAITLVQPPDTKAQKPSGKNENVFPNQIQVH